ncbi:MAG: helix-turn-helix domain-containing protein [Oscillospiraceae bacterium]|nr:helix-turn-helix domain-containing protein [Oscillospiraceae bacterium]
MKRFKKSTATSRQFSATSAALDNALQSAADIEDYLARHAGNLLSQSLPEHLQMLLSQKGLRRADVVRGSLLDRTYVYQIFSGDKTPSRDKLIALAFGLGLSGQETQTMLKLSGNRELYVRDPRDALILFSIRRGKTIFETNEALSDHEFSLLGV